MTDESTLAYSMADESMADESKTDESIADQSMAYGIQKVKKY